MPLFICEMVYIEVMLGQTMDWTIVKKSRNIMFPTNPNIPRAGPSRTPHEGLGQRKNIKAGLLDAKYV